MRDLVNWKDHVVEFPGRYEEKDLGDGLVQHTASPGKVKQQGTPQNATNFNIMDMAALEAMLMSSENARNILHIGRILEGCLETRSRLRLPIPRNIRITIQRKRFSCR